MTEPGAQNANALILHGTLIDGMGNPLMPGDLRIRDGRITEIGTGIAPLPDEEIIEAQGLMVTPGFIDAHCHTDMYAADCPEACGKIMQGVTTDVCGLCGDSPAPIGTGNLEEFRARREYRLPGGAELSACTFSDYREQRNTVGNTTNMALFVGNCNLRVHAIGYENRPASAVEMDMMKGLLRESMEAGAYGLSTGLTYVPSMFASQEELTELSRVIAGYGGIYNSHMRNEGDQVLKSIDEVISITEQSGCIGHISHLKVSGLANHGRSQECLERIHKACDRGVPITFDVYPYTAGSCGLRTLLPPELLEQGVEGGSGPGASQMLAHLRRRLKEADWDNLLLSCGAEQITVSEAAGRKEFEGKSLREIGDILQTDKAETLIQVLKAANGQGTIIYHALWEKDLRTFIQDPLCTIGTDAFARNYTGPTAAGRPHPRNYGAFPRFVRKYLLDEKLLPLEKGIEKITSLAARQFQIPDRGVLRPGAIADITIFDPARIGETGDFLTPARPPKGIEYVFVGGRTAVRQGSFADIRGGRVLKHI